MGQAKRRGTYEERVAIAIVRNEGLNRQIVGNPKMAKFAAEYGTQRLATRLVMAGALAPAPSFTEMQRIVNEQPKETK